MEWPLDESSDEVILSDACYLALTDAHLVNTSELLADSVEIDYYDVGFVEQILSQYACLPHQFKPY